MIDVRAYPLAWPQGHPRTAPWKRSDSRFKKHSFATQRDLLFAELNRMGVRSAVISTNVELRQDGLPYANRRNPEDPGVAIYFVRKKKQLAMACDGYLRIVENLRALAVTIEALRKIERHGSTALMEQAFSGFEALPPPPRPSGLDWRAVLGTHSTETNLKHVERVYRGLVQYHHPDRGGDPAKMIEITAAINAARLELG